MLNTNLAGKYILVTGASSGIGEDTVRRLSVEGAIVVMVARNEEKMKQIALELQGKTYIYSCDLAKTDDIKNIFQFIRGEGFKLDGLIHAAGIVKTLPVKAVSIEEMQRNMQTHYFAFFELGKCFLKKCYSNEGSSIIAISSLASLACPKGLSQYSASKAAVNAAVKTMSKEFIARKIRVNAIAPAFVDTEMAKEPMGFMEDFGKYLHEIQPMGMIPIEQISSLIEFLLGDTSKYITGEIIVVSAGSQ